MRSFFQILTLGILFTFASCTDWSKGKFYLTNHTNYLIDSIRIGPDKQFGKRSFSLKPNETMKFITERGSRGDSVPADGPYIIQYMINGQPRSKIFDIIPMEILLKTL